MTVLLHCEQGSPEWHTARRGIPTASCFDKIVTPTGKLSTSAEKYRRSLIGAWLAGVDEEQYVSPAMEHGTLHEPEARKWYAFTHDTTVQTVGFAYLDDRKLIGCSPDGLVGDSGALEIKCPQFGTHIANLLADPEKAIQDYRPQIQGALWILNREWCDFVSYHPIPSLPKRVIRVRRDEEYIGLLRTAVEQFVTLMLQERAYLEEQYHSRAQEDPFCKEDPFCRV